MDVRRAFSVRSRDGQDVAATRTVEATPARSPATVDSIKEGLGEVFDITHGRWRVVEKFMFLSVLL